MVEVPVKIYVTNLAKKAAESAKAMALLPTPVKNRALTELADRLMADEDRLLEANRLDVESVGKGLERLAAKQAVERVRLTADSVKGFSERLRQIAELRDPVGEVTRMWLRPNGMQVSRVRVPIGVIGIVSELGPGIMLDSMALCLKSGNACLYRGAPEWQQTNVFFAMLLREVLEGAGVPSAGVTILDRPEKEAALELMRQTKYLDALIPRGGAGLRKAVMEQSRLPILCHDGGVSHVYIDADADLPLAQNVVINSKVQLPDAGNAADTLLVHQSIARTLLPALVRRLLDEFKVEVRGCPKTIALTGSQPISGHKSVVEATEEDWQKQFRGRTMAVKMVKDMDEALAHIAAYGPGHTDAIVTRDYTTAMRFVREVDAGAVLVNASTRLHEGEEFGLGAEIGVSTLRTHARGTVTLDKLTCEKYVVFGTGQLRQPHPVPVTYEDAIMLKRPS